MSGHSKWSSIKHQKGVTDARRSQLFTKLTREIIVAVREGGSNPEANFRLRLAVQKARDSNMPTDNIDRAVKRGAGETEGVSLVELVLEGYGSGCVAWLFDSKGLIMIEANDLDTEALALEAIDAGAEDVNVEDNQTGYRGAGAGGD